MMNQSVQQIFRDDDREQNTDKYYDKDQMEKMAQESLQNMGDAITKPDNEPISGM